LTRYVRAAVVAAAAAAALRPAASASAEFACPLGTKPVWTGLYSPLTGQPVYVSFLSPGP
jgi:hypothetical protein